MATYVKVAIGMTQWLRTWAGEYPNVTNVLEGDNSIGGAVYFDVSTMTSSQINKFIKDFEAEIVKVTTEVEQLPT